MCARAIALDPAARPTASELARVLDAHVRALAFDAAELSLLVAGVAPLVDEAWAPHAWWWHASTHTPNDARASNV